MTEFMLALDAMSWWEVAVGLIALSSLGFLLVAQHELDQEHRAMSPRPLRTLHDLPRSPEETSEIRSVLRVAK
jgi:hypothetical protein